MPCYLTFEHEGRESFGAAVGDEVIDLGAQADDLLAIIEDGFQPIIEGPAIPLEAIRFLPPIEEPQKIICVGVNYGDRNEEYKDGSNAPRYPSVFVRFPGSLVGHREPIIRPRESKQFDYEGEIVLVIGKPGRRIRQANALDHVFGLTLANEGSVRDWMRHGKFNVTQGKNFDRSGSIGPWITTSDECPPFDNLKLTTRVNGEIRQQDATSNLLFSFRYLIAYVSTFTTLQPGDLILAGTPTGAGARFDPPKWLLPGDVVEVEVEGVGKLKNQVVDESG
jgi:5-carboxymethyl-2-hydroxymuconate isomerase